MKKFKILLLIASLTVILMQARTVREEVSVLFPNDVDKIQPQFMDNATRLKTLDSLFQVVANDSILALQYVELAGWASPPATAIYNVNLSERRAKAMRNWLLQNNCINEADSVVVTFNGVNYPLLSKLVRESNYRYADEVLDIIEDLPAPGETDTRYLRLKRLRGGLVWRELTQAFYHEMRRTDVVLHFLAPDPIPEDDSAKVVLIPEDVFTGDEEVEISEEVENLEIIPEPTPPYYWSVHTNLLYAALTIPNLGAEYYLGSNISVFGNIWYAWWDTDHKHVYWRTYGAYLAGRYWLNFKKDIKPLTGHHIGMYGQAFLYDFELGGIGYLSGTPTKNIFHKPTWSVGLEYGYSLPIGKHLNLDFTLAVGYLQGEYQKYKPADDEYLWQSTHMKRWVGPTKLEVSLVWLLGPGNVNKKKKGG